MKRTILTCLVLLAMAGTASAMYTYIDVGPGQAYSGFVNDLGQVAAWSWDAGGGETYTYDYYTATTTVIKIGELMQPTGINNAGVVGAFAGNYGYWYDGTWKGGYLGRTNNINDTYTARSYGEGGAILRNMATNTDIVRTTPDSTGQWPKINNLDDVVVGTWHYDDSSATWTKHAAYTLNGINDLGHLVGNAPGYNTHYYDGSSWIQLPELAGWGNTGGRDISNNNEIVGYSYNGGWSASHAFVWDPANGLRDLNDPAVTSGIPAGYRLEMPNDINQLGWIAGYAIDTATGAERTFLLVPEPATLGVLLLGAGLYLLRRRR